MKKGLVEDMKMHGHVLQSALNGLQACLTSLVRGGACVSRGSGLCCRQEKTAKGMQGEAIQQQVIALECAITNFIAKVKHVRKLYPKKDKPATKS